MHCFILLLSVAAFAGNHTLNSDELEVRIDISAPRVLEYIRKDNDGRIYGSLEQGEWSVEILRRSDGRRSVIGWQWFREIYMNNSSVWSYDLSANTWRDLRPLPEPHIRPLRCAAWDSDHQVIVVFGGEGGRDVYQNWSRWHLGFRDEWWLRNYERWLYQREIEPDGCTVRTYHIETPVKFNEEKYEARRTDHENGSDYIYFNVDDKFIMGGSNEVQIKVTYLDNNSDEWWIEYDAADGNPYRRSSSVGNQDDEKWKTVTFAIDDASFQNRQRTGMDFRIFNGGKNDLTVRSVRVVKMKPNMDR